jgi:hypothetical protein
LKEYRTDQSVQICICKEVVLWRGSIFIIELGVYNAKLFGDLYRFDYDPDHLSITLNHLIKSEVVYHCRLSKRHQECLL